VSTDQKVEQELEQELELERFAGEFYWISKLSQCLTVIRRRKALLISQAIFAAGAQIRLDPSTKDQPLSYLRLSPV
jgi:hypothetical protein